MKCNKKKELVRFINKHCKSNCDELKYVNKKDEFRYKTHRYFNNKLYRGEREVVLNSKIKLKRMPISNRDSVDNLAVDSVEKEINYITRWFSSYVLLKKSLLNEQLDSLEKIECNILIKYLEEECNVKKVLVSQYGSERVFKQTSLYNKGDYNE